MKSEANPILLYVNPMGYSNLGQYDHALLEGIQQWDVHYLTSSLHQFPLEESAEKVFEYSTKKGVFKVISYMRSQFTVLRKVKKLKPAIVHFQWFKFFGFDYWILKKIQGLGCRVILTAHNKLPHNTGNKYVEIHKKIYTQLDGIIVHVSSTKEDICREFLIDESKIHVIPHGLLSSNDTNPEVVKQIKTSFEKAHSLKDKMVFSMMGSLSAYKGVDLVIQMWSEYYQNQVNAVLVLAGKTSAEFEPAIQQVQNCVHINRYLETNEFQALMELSDCVLLPYKDISQSGLLLSCLSNRKRVIVSSHESLIEPFQFGEIGVVLEELSPEAIYNATQKMLLNREEPSPEIWEKINEHYDWFKIATKTESLYNSLLNPVELKR